MCSVCAVCLQQVVDGVLAIQREGEPLDLHMVEIQEMQHKTDMDTRCVVRPVLPMLVRAVAQWLLLHNHSRLSYNWLRTKNKIASKSRPLLHSADSDLT